MCLGLLISAAKVSVATFVAVPTAAAKFLLMMDGQELFHLVA